jgi:hypothetical protein
MGLAVKVVQMLARIVFVALLVLGILFWTGHASALIPLHMLLGIAFAVLLLILAGMALGRRSATGLAVLLIVWALVLPLFGLTQDSILVGGAHWLVQIIHLLLGIGAIAVAEILVARALRPRKR